MGKSKKAASAREQWILLHGFNYVDPPEGTSSHRVEHMRTEVWFIIKPTANGSQVEEIYKDLPRDQSEEFAYNQSGCAIVGSSLYVLGGRGDRRSTLNRFSSHVRRLDTRNPNEGWKTFGSLPFPCANATVGVAGNFIYIFPLFGGDRETQVGCVYDTINQKGWPIQFAPDCSDCGLSAPASNGRSPFFFCAAFDDGPENRGVIVSKRWKHVYLYNPDQNSWKSFCNFLLPDCRSWIPPPVHAALNGILYLSCCDGDNDDPTIFLSLYDYGTGNGLVYDLPLKFKNLCVETDSWLFLVAIADYKLCYLWYRGTYLSKKRILFLAKVELYFDTLSGTFNATHSEEELGLDVDTLYNCLPFDSNLYQKPKGECRQQMELKKSRRPKKSVWRRKVSGDHGFAKESLVTESAPCVITRDRPNAVSMQ